jgi:3',5'-cyclic AMP phosphodiesterase CpdA
MTSSLCLAVTADLHWGTHRRGDEATQLLLNFLRRRTPNVLVLAGDVGAGRHFAACLSLFDDVSCQKALVPGNHDIWVEANDERGDSLQVYREHLPSLCAAHGFRYLDRELFLLPEAGLALAGSINWYDYSWSVEALRQQAPDWEERLRTKRFSRARHNDANFVRWSIDDRRFTAEVVAQLGRHLEEAFRSVDRAVVVTHHPCFYGLNFPRTGPASVDALLWDAFSGNRTLEELLRQHAARIPFVFCGHTHRAREGDLDGIRGYNIGGDYHFKRLLLLDWPAGTVEVHTFGDPAP